MGNVDYEWTGGAPDDGLPYPTEQSSPNSARDIKKLAETLDDHIAELEAHVDECCPPIPPPLPPLPNEHKFVSNKELVWNDLPLREPDNGSLVELSRETRDDVPVVVETGEMVERLVHEPDEHGDLVMELVPETEVQYETRTTYTYQANFDWHNRGQKSLSWLVDVLAFEDNRIRDGYMAFKNSPATTFTALPNLDTSYCANMYEMFLGCHAFNQPLDNFDTSNVWSMSAMFANCYAFNQPLDFDTSKITQSMRVMFRDCSAFYQDISHWCVERQSSKPTDFDLRAGFEGQNHLQPQWGQPC